MKFFKYLLLFVLFFSVPLAPLAPASRASARRVSQLVGGGSALAALVTGGYYGWLRYRLAHAKTKDEQRALRERARQVLGPLVGFSLAAVGGGAVAFGLKGNHEEKLVPEQREEQRLLNRPAVGDRGTSSLEPLIVEDLQKDVDYPKLKPELYFSGFTLAYQDEQLSAFSVEQALMGWWGFGDLNRIAPGSKIKLLKRIPVSAQLESDGLSEPLNNNDELLIDEAGQFYLRFISSKQVYRLRGTSMHHPNKVMVCGELLSQVPSIKHIIELGMIDKSLPVLSDEQVCHKLFTILNGVVPERMLDAVACCENKGNFCTRMEDACIVRHDTYKNITAFFVCDGHAGPEAAYYCAQYLFDEMIRTISSFTPESVKEFLIKFDEKLKNVAQFQCGAFMQPRTDSFGVGESTPGTTLSGVLILPSGDFLLINLGDSRTIGLDNAGALVQSCVTVDHSVANLEEASRVRAAGGTIECKRVCATGRTGVAVTRALGDFQLKDIRGQNVISNVADLRLIDKKVGVQYLVIACDGLWDVMDNQRVASFVKDGISSHKSLSTITQYLVTLARNTTVECHDGRRPNNDNISVIIVDLEKLRSTQQSPVSA